MASIIVSYDGLGNIQTKAGVGNYTYGTGGAGPHMVTSAEGVTKTSSRHHD